MALGGRIDLDSEVGRGSKFELVLPTLPGSREGGFAVFEAVDLGAAAGVEGRLRSIRARRTSMPLQPE